MDLIVSRITMFYVLSIEAAYCLLQIKAIVKLLKTEFDCFAYLVMILEYQQWL